MKLIQQMNNLNAYLEASEIIDFGYTRSQEITELSFDITAHSENITDFVKNAYEFVRDKISHSADINGNKVTCKASEVLSSGEGICFAKSHLLAAILRCNLIPTGFCYQRLLLDDESAPYLILHGLNAVYLEEFNQWIRLDARGNKSGVDAQFSIQYEKLAFPVRPELGEEDIPIIFPVPDRNVISALTNYADLDMLWAHLPNSLYYNFSGERNMNIKLKKLCPNDNNEIYQMLQELPENENDFMNSIFGKTFDEYTEWLKICSTEAEQTEIIDGWKVPESIYWLFVNEEPVGYGKIRHFLTEALLTIQKCNLPSVNTALGNGGVIEKSTNDIHYIWIDCC